MMIADTILPFPVTGTMTWAAWYNTWLLIELTPKAIVLSFLTGTMIRWQL